MTKTTTTRLTPAQINLGDQIMERLRRVATTTFAASAIVLAGSFALAMNADADPVRVANLGQYSSLNLRTAPTTQSSVITRMPKGATNLDWTGNAVTNGSTLWWEVSYNGRTGWAAARYLEPYSTYTQPAPTVNYAQPTVTYVDPNEYVPAYDYTPSYSPSYTTGHNGGNVQYSSGGNVITEEQVGAALFGLVVGGILGAVITHDDGSNTSPTIVQPVPQPTPQPQPAPQPRRFQLNCSGQGVHFTYQRHSSDVSLNINGRRVNAHATDRAGDGNSFAVPFTSNRGNGTLFVENIHAGGNNASLYWDGNRGNGLYNVNCSRSRV